MLILSDYPSSKITGIIEVEEGWTFGAVEERLVEAIGFLRRLPDQERGWLNGAGTMSLWRQASATLGMTAIEYVGYMHADRDVAPRLPGLTVAQVGRMEEALEWTTALPADDRRILGLGIGQLASGSSRISWDVVMRIMGKNRGKDGVRKRYSRAIAAIAGNLNSQRFQCRERVNPENVHP